MAPPISEKSFAVDSKYCHFYAGGEIAWSLDGTLMYCLNSTEITVVDVVSGLTVKTYNLNPPEEQKNSNKTEDFTEEDTIYSFALTPKNEHIVTAHRSGLLRLWSTETGEIIKLWKSQHKGPIVKVIFSPCGKLICSSGADSTLRVWDYVNSTCLGVLREFTGPSTLLSFHPNTDKKEIYAAGSNHSIFCWNYDQRKLMYTLLGHISQVTGLSFVDNSSDCKYLATVGRDKVLIIWDLSIGEQYKVIPIYEELEGCVFYKSDTSENKLKVIVGSVLGNIKMVNCNESQITTLVNSTDYELKGLLYSYKSEQLAAITAEQNILIYKMAVKEEVVTVDCIKHLIGFNDEILDLCYFGENERFLAVATNSNNIKIYDTSNEMNCKIVSGHTNTVITLASTGSGDNFFLSSGKDFCICLWEIDPENFALNCLVKSSSCHTSTIGSISFRFHDSAEYVSVSQDGSMKVWLLKKDKKSKKYSVQLKYSALAHEKDINSVTYAPNNKMIATGSVDKTAKLWSSDTATCLGTLRGHSRGVWCVRFSPVDQVLLTSSSDCSLRLWSISNMSCVKRFEQNCSIIRVEFIDHGKFILSGGTDGLLKVWSIKTGDCSQTMDEHTDRVWSLAVSHRSNKFFFSGGADSRLIKWKDITEEVRNNQIDSNHSTLLEEQTLQTLLQERKNMQKAFVLALKLDKPKASYNIICNYVRERNQNSVENAVKQLTPDQRITLLEHVKSWSTNTRHCKVANVILKYILDDILMVPSRGGYNISKMIEILTPYLQRHFRRANELQKDLAFLEYLVECM